MQSRPETFYINEVLNFKSEVQSIKTKLLLLALVRLLVFLSMAGGIYLTIDFSPWPIVIGVVGFAIFLFLVSRYADLKLHKERVSYLIKINQDEVDRMTGQIVDTENGMAYIDDKHAFSSDIDLFGSGSFYEMVNRTELKEGSETLANTLKANNIHNIVDKQEAIKELSNKPAWRHNYKASAHMVKTKVSRQVIVDWLRQYQAFVPNYMRYLAISISIASIVLVGAYFFGFVSHIYVLFALFVGLGITGGYVKRINKLSIYVSELKLAFSNYAKLLKQIEDTDFQSEFCLIQKQKIESEGRLSSEILTEFSKYLSALDQRNNILFAVIGNGFLLWDAHQAYKIEKWIKSYGALVEKWFETIEFFDAYNSLATFVFNKPEYKYPKIDLEAKQVIQAKALGHVMIDNKKRIDNDFEINTTSFRIITGANMAGKSTFLRTIALTIVSANIGLPICCESMTYRPIKLVTSMRNTDSLQDDSSYFFSELVRLKYIVDIIQSEPYFIILDEILKGTNSKDKEEGSKKLMHKLSKTSSSGVIATHDLGLCEIANEIEAIENQYFDAEIFQGELKFDYTLKPGICQNMNASFLLHKMEIV